MAEYEVGTILEDNAEDRWIVESPGELRALWGSMTVRQMVERVEDDYGPLKVVEELNPINEIYGDDDNLMEHTTGYTTKDSGERQVYLTGMQRDTSSGKPRFDLLVPLGVPFEHSFLTRFAALMQRGAEKYDARNWEQARTDEELARFKESALRHMMQWITGETDEDHAAAVAFNLMAHETTLWKRANNG